MANDCGMDCEKNITANAKVTIATSKYRSPISGTLLHQQNANSPPKLRIRRPFTARTKLIFRQLHAIKICQKL